MPTKKKQKGGYSYGFTKESFGHVAPGKNSYPPVQKFTSCGGQAGGGLVGAPIKGNIGARPEFLKPGFGFSNPQFISTPPNFSSYESGGCPKVGGRKKKKRTNRKRTNRKRTNRKKTNRKRTNRKRTKRTNRTNRKRRNRKRRRNTKKKIRRRLIGCGQKGGRSILLDDTAPNITSFPGKLDVSMANPNSLPNVKTLGNSGFFNGPNNTYTHTGH
jgi:hypothetical protein